MNLNSNIVGDVFSFIFLWAVHSLLWHLEGFERFLDEHRTVNLYELDPVIMVFANKYHCELALSLTWGAFRSQTICFVTI